MINVYRMYDKNWILLYIGVSAHPFTRFECHKAVSSGVIPNWFVSVAFIQISHHSNRKAALAVEKKEIIAHDPAYNHQYSSRDPKIKREKAA